MKMQRVIKSAVVAALGLAAATSGAQLLLKDTFVSAAVDPASRDINVDLNLRQTGSLASPTSTWSDNEPASADWAAQINGGNSLKIHSIASTINAKLNVDFAATANDVNVTTDFHSDDFNNVMLMFGVGMSAADGFNDNGGYSFRLDTRGGARNLQLVDNGTAVGSAMDVSSILTLGGDQLSIDFTGGNTVSASLNGTAIDFGGGIGTSYTGTSEPENYIQLSQYNQSAGWVGSRFFQTTVTAIPEPSVLALMGFAAAGLLGTRRFRR